MARITTNQGLGDKCDEYIICYLYIYTYIHNTLLSQGLNDCPQPVPRSPCCRLPERVWAHPCRFCLEPHRVTSRMELLFPLKNTGGKHWKKHWNNSAWCWGFIPEIHQNSKEAAHFLTHLSNENHESGGSGQLYTNLKPGARFFQTSNGAGCGDHPRSGRRRRKRTTGHLLAGNAWGTGAAVTGATAMKMSNCDFTQEWLVVHAQFISKQGKHEDVVQNKMKTTSLAAWGDAMHSHRPITMFHGPTPPLEGEDQLAPLSRPTMACSGVHFLSRVAAKNSFGQEDGNGWPNGKERHSRGQVFWWRPWMALVHRHHSHDINLLKLESWRPRPCPCTRCCHSYEALK